MLGAVLSEGDESSQQTKEPPDLGELGRSGDTSLTLLRSGLPDLIVDDVDSGNVGNIFGCNLNRDDETSNNSFNLTLNSSGSDGKAITGLEPGQPNKVEQKADTLQSPRLAKRRPSFLNMFDSWTKDNRTGNEYTYEPRLRVEEEETSTADEEYTYLHLIGTACQKVAGILARRYYTLKFLTLVMAFFINFLLLFYKVQTLAKDFTDIDTDGDNITDINLGGEMEDDDDADDIVYEYLTFDEDLLYIGPILQTLAKCHTLVSFCMLIAYYSLKVPLLIFKKEKEIARSLEFDGLYVVEEPESTDFSSQWNRIVISTKSFPQNYWDKFVKRKVRNKYSETVGYNEISKMLGIGLSDNLFEVDEEISTSFFSSILKSVDWKYYAWKFGVIFTDNSFLYCFLYFVLSVGGNFNHFIFAAHLLDIAIGIKTLSTILKSVTHNGKQLVLTVMLTSVVIYMYTVVAFNCFRQFYSQEGDEEEVGEHKCHDMLTCFIFHLHKGLRAGGGIGDEIEDADGDIYEYYRIIFDLTFFFFVIVILLAIIQGLIIDAFGELRDQLEQVKEDMETKCFICGIGKDYFDGVPHGFETHTEKEQNFANYMFFLMYIINKPETEHTGQESYVWQLYQNRIWEFFPVGDCFRKQYEDELMQ